MVTAVTTPGVHVLAIHAVASSAPVRASPPTGIACSPPRRSRGVAIEIDGDPSRQDVDFELAQRAVECRLPLRARQRCAQRRRAALRRDRRRPRASRRHPEGAHHQLLGHRPPASDGSRRRGHDDRLIPYDAPTHMREVVIVSSKRTPLAKSARGSFNITRPDDLAGHAIRHVLGKAPALDPAEIEEVVLGCGQPHGAQGHNIARVAALRAGLPVTTPGVTVNRFCNSGLQAIVQAAHMVLQEGVEAAIGGGVESITMMQRDQLAESLGQGAASRASTWRWARRRKSSPSATASRARRRTNCRSSASSASRTRSRTGSSTGEIAPMDVTRAMLDKKTGEKIGEETVHGRSRRVQSRRHDDRGARRSCRRSSTRRAARAASPRATRRSSPTARRRRS